MGLEAVAAAPVIWVNGVVVLRRDALVPVRA